MEPIPKLMDEHRRIITVLDAFDRFAAQTEAGGQCDRSRLGKFAHFIRDYSDHYHHAKEENILFVMMEEHGFSRDAGPVAVMLYEHDEGRKLVKFLREASAEPQELTGEEVEAVVKAIRSFTYLLRSHISKEDNILYPMALSHLPRQALTAMSLQFEKLEAERDGSGEVAMLESLAEELTKTA